MQAHYLTRAQHSLNCTLYNILKCCPIFTYLQTPNKFIQHYSKRKRCIEWYKWGIIKPLLRVHFVILNVYIWNSWNLYAGRGRDRPVGRWQSSYAWAPIKHLIWFVQFAYPDPTVMREQVFVFERDNIWCFIGDTKKWPFNALMNNSSLFYFIRFEEIKKNKNNRA